MIKKKLARLVHSQTPFFVLQNDGAASALAYVQTLDGGGIAS